MFVTRAMSPVRYVGAGERFTARQDALNVVLAFSGYRVRDVGKVIRAIREATLDGAKARAGKLRALLEAKGTHAEMLKY